MLIFSSMVLIPSSVLLSISFFIFISVRKLQDNQVKTFGYIVIGVLWLAILSIAAGAVQGMGRYGMQKGSMMQRRMGQMPMMQKGSMMQRQMPEAIDNRKLPEANPAARERGKNGQI